MDLDQALRCDTLEDIPGLSDELKQMYRNIKRLESTQSNASTISDFDTNEMENPDEEDKHPVITSAVMEMLKKSGVNVENIRVVLSKVSCHEEQEYVEEVVDAAELSQYLTESQAIKKQDSVESTTESTSTERSS